MEASQLAAINTFLQGELESRGLLEVAAIEAARWLQDAGHLKDSVSRPGLPLRNLLRAGLITGQRQEPNRRWFIDRVNAGGAAASPSPETMQPLPHASMDIVMWRWLGHIGELLHGRLPQHPWLEECGVYAIKVPESFVPEFISPEEARRARNVLFPWPLDRLRSKWVPTADTVYIGLAGRSAPRSLKKRIGDLLRHASGRTSDRGPHKGGEILWQLRGYRALQLWAAPTNVPPAPRETEKALLRQFTKRYGLLPFANRQG